MSFFLTDEMEENVSIFLQRENEQICRRQLQSPDILPEFKDMIQKTLDSGSPVPYFDTRFGYYSISFTPCEYGNRVYIHHHISDRSELIYDPSKDVTDGFDAKVTLRNVIDEEPTQENQVKTDMESPFETLDIPTRQYNMEAEQMMQNIMSGPPGMPGN